MRKQVLDASDDDSDGLGGAPEPLQMAALQLPAAAQKPPAPASNGAVKLPAASGEHAAQPAKDDGSAAATPKGDHCGFLQLYCPPSICSYLEFTSAGSHADALRLLSAHLPRGPEFELHLMSDGASFTDSQPACIQIHSQSCSTLILQQASQGPHFILHQRHLSLHPHKDQSCAAADDAAA